MSLQPGLLPTRKSVSSYQKELVQSSLLALYPYMLLGELDLEQDPQ